MKFENYIVLDDTIKIYKEDGDEYEYSYAGMVFMTPESTLPIIVKGKGCVGIGTIKSITLTSTRTTITFIKHNCDKAYSDAYYSLYKTNAHINASADGDIYSNTDIAIPGMGAPVAMRDPKELLRNSSKRNRRDYDDNDDRSFSSMMRRSSDDVHW